MTANEDNKYQLYMVYYLQPSKQFIENLDRKKNLNNYKQLIINLL